MDKAMHSEIPQWVIDYNNAGHQSSAGRAVNILMKENQSLRSELQKLNDFISASEQFNATQNQSYRDSIEKLNSKLEKQKELNAELVKYVEKLFAPMSSIGDFTRLQNEGRTLIQKHKEQ